MPKISRYTLQVQMQADIEAAIAKVEAAHDLKDDLDAQRRLFRSVVTIAASRLMAKGISPQLVAVQAFKAVVDEHQRATQTQPGTIFGGGPKSLVA